MIDVGRERPLPVVSTLRQGVKVTNLNNPSVTSWEEQFFQGLSVPGFRFFMIDHIVLGMTGEMLCTGKLRQSMEA